MADIELTHLQLIQRKCQNLQPQVARQSFNFQFRRVAKHHWVRQKLEQSGALINKPLPLEPDYALFRPVSGNQENAQQARPYYFQCIHQIVGGQQSPPSARKSAFLQVGTGGRLAAVMRSIHIVGANENIGTFSRRFDTIKGGFVGMQVSHLTFKMD
jgi:hypothetical protein